MSNTDFLLVQILCLNLQKTNNFSPSLTDIDFSHRKLGMKLEKTLAQVIKDVCYNVCLSSLTHLKSSMLCFTALLEEKYTDYFGLLGFKIPLEERKWV